MGANHGRRETHDDAGFPERAADAEHAESYSCAAEADTVTHADTDGTYSKGRLMNDAAPPDEEKAPNRRDTPQRPRQPHERRRPAEADQPVGETDGQSDGGAQDPVIPEPVTPPQPRQRGPNFPIEIRL